MRNHLLINPAAWPQPRAVYEHSWVMKPHALWALSSCTHTLLPWRWPSRHLPPATTLPRRAGWGLLHTSPHPRRLGNCASLRDLPGGRKGHVIGQDLGCSGRMAVGGRPGGLIIGLLLKISLLVTDGQWPRCCQQTLQPQSSWRSQGDSKVSQCQVRLAAK